LFFVDQEARRHQNPHTLPKQANTMADGAVSGVKRTAEEQLTKENSKNEDLDHASSEVHPIPILTFTNKNTQTLQDKRWEPAAAEEMEKRRCPSVQFLAYPFHHF